MYCCCRLLQKTDWFTQEKAARLLTAVLETRPNKSIVANGHAPSTSTASADPIDDQAADQAVQPIMAGFIEWLCTQLRCVRGCQGRQLTLSLWSRPAACSMGVGVMANSTGRALLRTGLPTSSRKGLWQRSCDLIRPELRLPVCSGLSLVLLLHACMCSRASSRPSITKLYLKRCLGHRSICQELLT